MSNELARNVTNAAQGASVTSVAAADSNVALLGSTLGRRGLIVYNDCDKSLYLKYGATSSLSFCRGHERKSRGHGSSENGIYSKSARILRAVTQ